MKAGFITTANEFARWARVNDRIQFFYNDKPRLGRVEKVLKTAVLVEIEDPHEFKNFSFNKMVSLENLTVPG